MTLSAPRSSKRRSHRRSSSRKSHRRSSSRRSHRRSSSRKSHKRHSHKRHSHYTNYVKEHYASAKRAVMRKSSASGQSLARAVFKELGHMWRAHQHALGKKVMSRKRRSTRKGVRKGPSKKSLMKKAKREGVKGRSKMSKTQLKHALGM